MADTPLSRSGKSKVGTLVTDSRLKYFKRPIKSSKSALFQAWAGPYLPHVSTSIRPIFSLTLCPPSASFYCPAFMGKLVTKAPACPIDRNEHVGWLLLIINNSSGGIPTL